VESIDAGWVDAYQDAQGPVVGDPPKVHDPGYLVVCQRGIRRAAQLQLACTAIALEPVEQDADVLELHSLGYLITPKGQAELDLLRKHPAS